MNNRKSVGRGWASLFSSRVLVAAAVGLSLFGSVSRTSLVLAQSQPDASKSRVDALVEKMTPEEKIDYIGGTGFAIRAVPRLGLPSIEMSDGPFGVRSNTHFPSTTYAAGINLAASWDPELASRVGAGIGKDARARGVHFMLGPGVNIYRSPTNGRNFEYFGEDPFLTSAITVGYITGMQKQGVSATVKHFLGNNSEFDRHNSDSIIDERTLREIYLPSFEAAVKQAHVGAIMDSYNFVNGQHMTQNGYFNSQIARKEWGFDGVMMSDWDATYDAVGAANGGLDIEMPTGKFMNRKNLLPAIADGKVKQATIDEKIRRILLTANRFGWLDREQTDLSLPTFNEPNREVAHDAALEGMVLLKNAGNLLPLDKEKTKSVLVVGPDAYPAATVAGGSAGVVPFNAVSVLQGIGNYLGKNATIYYERGLPEVKDLAGATEFVTSVDGSQRGVKIEEFENKDLSGKPESTTTIRHINEAGTSWGNIDLEPDQLEALFASLDSTPATSRRFSGYYVARQGGTYEVVAQSSGEGSGYRLYIDDKLIFDAWKMVTALENSAIIELTAGPHKIVAEDFKAFPIGGRMRVGITDEKLLVSDAAKKIAGKVDAVLVAVGYDADSESEGGDRSFNLPVGQDELIREMGAINKNTVVAVTSGGSVNASRWIENVPAYIEMWYPGQEGGTALAEILFGAVSPSGRLPITWEKQWQDDPAYANYYEDTKSKKVTYKEGIFIGYRGFEHNKIKPLFPFGYGLSYTTFKYDNLKVTGSSGQADATSAMSQSGRPALFTVSFDVTNTGKIRGADVAQVYVTEENAKVARPPQELKGFMRVRLAPDETKHVSIALDARAFAYYDVNAKLWRADAGNYTVKVGRSSEDMQFSSSITLPSGIEIGTEK